jgi:hypothetical protein
MKEIKRWVGDVERVKLIRTAFYGTRKCIDAFERACLHTILNQLYDFEKIMFCFLLNLDF